MSKIDENRKYPMNGIRFCIDSEGDALAGRMYSKMAKNPIQFENSSDMLLRADDLFDQQGYPQRFLEPKSFWEKEETVSHFHYPEAVTLEKEILKQRGKCCTLDVFVQSRRKAGWQGIVFEPEKGFLGEFKSEMEFLYIVDQEMKKQKQGKEG